MRTRGKGIRRRERNDSVPVRALELFCGMGGFAAAVRGSDLQVVAAYDKDAAALATYRRNFPDQRLLAADLERVTAAELAGHGAALWWLSPPCQPYCGRGARRDLDDPRARSLLRIVGILAALEEGQLPPRLALENVAGFQESRARNLLTETLAARGYELSERLLCPTELGIPSRRPRYYLAASRVGRPDPGAPAPRPLRPLREYLSADPEPPAELLMEPATLQRFGAGFRILDPDSPGAYTTCFTSGYGRSLMAAGSYLACSRGVRYFAPEEIARLLGFPADFSFPAGLSLRKKWALAGNSLSVAAVRQVLYTLGLLADT